MYVLKEVICLKYLKLFIVRQMYIYIGESEIFIRII
jgi:hypothetical protein